MPPKPRVCIDRLIPIDAERLRQRAEHPEKRNRGAELALIALKKWPSGSVLKCRFLNGSALLQQRVIEQAVKWHDHCNIRFEFVTSGPATIRISFLEDGSWSYIGNDANHIIDQSQPTMNFGWLNEYTDDAEVERVVLHEFGHALGAIHEHQNPAGNIKWNKPAVYAYYMGAPNFWTTEDVDTNLFFKYSSAETQFSAFDPKSIMLYPVPAAHTTDGKALSGGDTLSDTDKAFIAQCYPKGATPPSTTPLTIDAAPTSAAIGKAGEEDLYQFQVSSKGYHEIVTSGTTDVVMGLYGPNDASKLLTEDDDSGVGTNARIRRSLAKGTWVVKIRHYSESNTGAYQIQVKKG